MIEVSETAQNTASSKVYVRNFDYTAYYRIDRALPFVLDIQRNGGHRSLMTEADWIAFCDKFDECFASFNKPQCGIFFIDLMIGLTVFFYIMAVYLIYVIPPEIKFVYFLAGAIVLNVLFRLCLQGPVQRKAVAKANELCRDETNRINLRAGHGSSVDIAFRHRKRKLCSCEGYEFDSNNQRRYPEIHVEIKVDGLPQSSRAVGYGGETVTAVTVEECHDDNHNNNNIPTIDNTFFGETTENLPFARATEIRSESYRTSADRSDAPLEPYVPVPMAKAVVTEPQR